MKLEGVEDYTIEQASPPSRGAWIEMPILTFNTIIRPAAPLTGGVD